MLRNAHSINIKNSGGQGNVEKRAQHKHTKTVVGMEMLRNAHSINIENSGGQGNVEECAQHKHRKQWWARKC